MGEVVYQSVCLRCPDHDEPMFYDIMRDEWQCPKDWQRYWHMRGKLSKAPPLTPQSTVPT